MFDSFQEILMIVKEDPQALIDLILEEEKLYSGLNRDEILEKGRHALSVMRRSLEKGNTLDINLPIKESIEQSQFMLKPPIFLSKNMKEAVYWAMSIMEYSNGMGIICAAPTAGSSGIFPAVLFKAQDILNASDDDILNAYFVGAMVGVNIGNNGTISGAEGGCQAEVGVSAAMAAAAVTYLAKGKPAQIFEAVALALKNLMGLVCDPVAGLVISPCIKRNAIGVMDAFLAAEMALSGVTSIIPPDEVVEALKKVGEMIPIALKETSRGGIAATPTGKKIKRQIFGKIRED
jgi:L-serine dehydratase